MGGVGTGTDGSLTSRREGNVQGRESGNVQGRVHQFQLRGDWLVEETELDGGCRHWYGVGA